MKVRESYQNKKNLIIILCVVITVVVPVYIVWATEKITAGCIVGAACLLLDGMVYQMHRTDQKYIMSVVQELSDLLDTLMELEEREVFPETEDTMLSKLQANAAKLIRRMRHQNELTRQEQERMKGIISDLSHQLKTPLANLKMYSRFLQKDNLSENQYREYVDIICKSVERLNFLSENMIRISRLETGLIHLKCGHNRISETVLKAVKDIYPKARQMGCEIIYREDRERDTEAQFDADWTAEAVFNLLDNAVKYSEKAERKEIILSVRKLGLFAEISVEDHNGAISREEQNRIFRRFYRGENSTGKEGIGLGLYITREIALRQGGYVAVKATEKGNIFSIYLRL